MTVEDPIEYDHTDIMSTIEQRELGQDTPSFSEALRGFLRADPDIIMVGEMRDLETMQLAITAAETGHLVFATLHTNSAATSVGRIIDVFPPNQQPRIQTMLSSSLKVVVSQKLLRKKDGQGRVAALEILFNTSAIAHLIRENKPAQIQTQIEMGGSKKMLSMDKSLAILATHGIVEEDVALAAANNPESFKRFANSSTVNF